MGSKDINIWDSVIFLEFNVFNFSVNKQYVLVQCWDRHIFLLFLHMFQHSMSMTPKNAARLNNDSESQTKTETRTCLEQEEKATKIF